jgi:protein-tyrosine phosphatase
VLRHLAEAEGVDVEVESAGTGSWHVGNPPDERATAAARERGIMLAGAARQVSTADFDDYDLLIAMDRHNERDLLALAPDREAREKVRLLRTFDPEATAAGELDVPDPYYGGSDGFDHVLDVVERAARGLLDDLR